MPTIQTAASQRRLPMMQGPQLPPNGVIISVRHLPNPYGRLQEFKFTHNIPDADWPKRKRDQVKVFLRTLAPKKLDRVIQKGRNSIKLGKSIAVVCARGRHRSPAVAEMIGDGFHSSMITYEHRELQGAKGAGASGDDDC